MMRWLRQLLWRWQARLSSYTIPGAMSDMRTAYKVAALAVRQRLAEQYPDDLAALNSIRREDVATYTGSFDQAEELLRCLGIPVNVNPEAKALRAKVVFVNCSNAYDENLINLVARYVEDGLWLVTSDWALHYVIERCFPNIVRWTRRMTGDEVISVEPNLESLWSEIVVLGADPQWWLWGSYPIEVLDTQKVRIEAASHDLLVKYNAPVVAIDFKWGQGRVFHVISHFWAKRSGTPTSRHRGPYTDFLKAGMRLSDDGINKVLRESQIEPTALTFGTLQSAVTASELAAQLCIRAKRASL